MKHPQPCYQTTTQSKNLAWLLPRPKPDKYPGGMPLHCEEWLIALAKDFRKTRDQTAECVLRDE